MSWTRHGSVVNVASTKQLICGPIIEVQRRTVSAIVFAVHWSFNDKMHTFVFQLCMTNGKIHYHRTNNTQMYWMYFVLEQQWLSTYYISWHQCTIHRHRNESYPWYKWVITPNWPCRLLRNESRNGAYSFHDGSESFRCMLCPHVENVELWLEARSC